jgi:hypothetical protein
MLLDALTPETIVIILGFGFVELATGLWVGYQLGLRKGQPTPAQQGQYLGLTPDGQALLLGDQRHEVPTGVRQALRQGETINAIKTLRTHFPQLSLSEAKQLTDALSSDK